MFGGYLQLPTDFWALAGQPGGGALPSVHAAVGYSVFSLYFAGWALNNRRLRWLGLASGLILGSFFGALRILQGAHFLSQILWSLAFTWCLCSVLFYLLIVTKIGSASCREKVCQYGVDLGGRCSIKKKN